MTVIEQVESAATSSNVEDKRLVSLKRLAAPENRTMLGFMALSVIATTTRRVSDILSRSRKRTGSSLLTSNMAQGIFNRYYQKEFGFEDGLRLFNGTVLDYARDVNDLNRSVEVYPGEAVVLGSRQPGLRKFVGFTLIGKDSGKILYEADDLIEALDFTDNEAIKEEFGGVVSHTSLLTTVSRSTAAAYAESLQTMLDEMRGKEDMSINLGPALPFRDPVSPL